MYALSRPDTETKIKLNGDQTWIETAGVKWIVSPYDELAIEEALQLKSKMPDSTVTVVSAGPERTNEAIRTALAMGCDRGIRVDLPESADNSWTAKALAGALKKEEKVDIIFSGKEAIDDGSSQVSQLLGEYLSFPVATVVLDVEYGETSIKCKREIEGGAFEMMEVELPAIVAAQKGLNEPRYASLPNIMKAKKKEIAVVALADTGSSETDQKIKVTKLELPPPKQVGKKLEGSVEEMAQELVRILHQEVKVI